MTLFGFSVADRAKAFAFRFCRVMVIGLACLPAVAQTVDGRRDYVSEQEVLWLFQQREEARTTEVQRWQTPYLRLDDPYWAYRSSNPVLWNPPPPYCRPPAFTPPPPYRYCPRR